MDALYQQPGLQFLRRDSDVNVPGVRNTNLIGHPSLPPSSPLFSVESKACAVRCRVFWPTEGGEMCMGGATHLWREVFCVTFNFNRRKSWDDVSPPPAGSGSGISLPSVGFPPSKGSGSGILRSAGSGSGFPSVGRFSSVVRFRGRGGWLIVRVASDTQVLNHPVHGRVRGIRRRKGWL